MEFDKKLVAEEPESSWSENTTPGSDDIEEIVRREDDQLHIQIPTKDVGSLPRFMRPAIRRRLNIEERVCRGETTTKTFHVTTLDMRRSMDGSDASSTSNLTIVTSANSSCTDPWSSPGFVEEELDATWDAQDEDMLLVPKLEPIDDDVDMTGVKESTVPETPSASTSPVTTKRPRGRPRKHPKVNPDSVVKVAKGRSKTGCITCRKRKKKCDEAKPGCELDVVRRWLNLLTNANSIRYELREEFCHLRRLSSKDPMEEWKGESRRRYGDKSEQAESARTDCIDSPYAKGQQRATQHQITACHTRC